VTTPGADTSSYTIAATDATNGIVTITATFEHTSIDPNAPTITVGTVSARPNGKALVPISLTNNPGVTSFMVKVHFDDMAMKLVDVDDKLVLRGFMSQNTHSNTSPYILAWWDAQGAPVSADGIIAVLEFELYDIEVGDYAVAVTFDTEDIANGIVPVAFEKNAGKISVLSFIYGDADGNGRVTLIDATIVARFAAGWSFEAIPLNPATFIEAACDVDLSGRVTLIDATIIARHAAGWTGYEILPMPANQQGNQPIVGARAFMFGTPSLKAGDVSGIVGETVKVPVSIMQNPGVMSTMFTVSFDYTALRLVGFEDTGLLSGAFHPPYDGSMSTTFAWANLLADNNNTSSGEILFLEFEILKDSNQGEYAIELTFEPENTFNTGLAKVHFDTVSGSITTIPAPVTAPVIVGTDAIFISITETGKNSGVWALSFTVSETWSDGVTKIVPYTVGIRANNANVKGNYDLSAYTLIYDIAGNGSNVKEFRVVMNSIEAAEKAA